ncbi:ATPase [Treponema primitia ZAS-2]|uniref:ATPase n=1 Tax=Treponema primitia (strain ATCC BAA-887 / DSM 12427 / ZAS-2) TaxID=545694 RepID=F5YIA1_TREPZ|nr:ATP-binding protein [Treponema primitia]AEF84643.1 ATPase [Treponema primitia ZAS-2]
MLRRKVFWERVKPFVGTELIKVITGIRRCGKSVMLELIKEELRDQGVNPGNFISLNFEDLANRQFCTAEALNEHLEKAIVPLEGRVYLFLDEVQEVAEWERCINSLRVKYTVDIYITGSNAKLLSGELATYLAGRYVEIAITPFSFTEFTELYRTLEPELSVADAFQHFIVFGGMPFLHNLQYKAEPSYQYLRDVYNSVILKDIVKRNHIRDVDLLDRIILYVVANAGRPFSATSISRYFKHEGRITAPETILNYLRACEDAFLFHRIHRQDLMGKKILTVYEKYYLSDHGLREAVYGENKRDIGLILENIVCMELLRRGYTLTFGTIHDKEIDFVAERRRERIYIQVAYLLASEETVNREFSPLLKIRDNYPKYVLSMDEFDMSRDGILHRNIRDFLMDQGDVS